MVLFCFLICSQEYTKEVIIRSQCSHKNIVRLFGCCVEADDPMLVTEFVPNGNLSELLHGNSGQLPVSLETLTEFHCTEDVSVTLLSKEHKVFISHAKLSMKCP